MLTLHPLYTLFPETRAITCTCTGTHLSKFLCAIYCMQEISIFTFALILLYISHKEKFFIEGFFTEHYMQEI